MPAKPQRTWRAAAREAPPPAKVAGSGTEIDEADALTMAAMQGDDAQLRLLIEGGANVNVTDAIGVAPLHWAAFCGHGEVTGRLLDANADVHVRDQEGRTPLHVAAYESHTGVISALIGAGADVMAPDKSTRAHGRSPDVSLAVRSTPP